jgi:hypothetical protein
MILLNKVRLGPAPQPLFQNQEIPKPVAVILFALFV